MILSLLLFASGCRKDKELDALPENTALLEVMDAWYFFYRNMPDVNPANYPSPFELLEAVRYRPGDRWSYIDSWDDFLAYYNDAKYFGYGFGSAWSQNKLYVSFVYNESEMFGLGVRRGWILDAINGTSLLPGMNINQMLGANQAGVSNKFRFIRPDNSVTELTVFKQEIVMNAVLHAEVIERAQHTIGYLVLQGFTTPAIEEITEAVDYFIAENVDELILDIRYNGGGSGSVANYLSSIIGGDKVAGKLFSSYEYNDKQASSENHTENFVAVERKLQLDRLITICSRATASASELVINSLSPFMPVYIVGNDTYGKPMGSHIWNYDDKYAFVILSFKMKNAKGEGEYFEGLPANIYVADDLTRQFGDPEEANLREAIRLIETGILAKGSREVLPYIIQPWEQMSGIRAEIGAH